MNTFIILAATFCISVASYAAPQVIDTDWKDAARERIVPLKLRIPEGTEKVPLVIFSHGLGGSRDGGKVWGEHWSANGYFVIHVQHPGSDKALWLTGDGTLKQRVVRGATPEQLLGRVDDVRFVLDEIAKRQKNGDMQVSRIDLSRIAMTGHSFGAATAVALADARNPGPIKSLGDSRIAAFIAFSPAVAGGQRSWPDRYGAMKSPFFSVTGTIDGEVIGNGTTPAKRAALFDAQPPGDKYRVVFEGGDHFVFNGGELRESAVLPDLLGNTSAKTDPATAKVIYERTQRLTLKFLDAYLKGDGAAKAWLANDAAKWIGDAGAWSAK